MAENLVTLHHWIQGPADVRPTEKPYLLGLRGGQRARITHRYYWFLDRVEGTTRRKALTRIYDVLLHPRSWSRSGVHWVRVFDRTKADILVSVIPMATTACGPSAAGCFSWGHPDGKTRAECGVEYIDRPEWGVLVNMELCGHGTFRGHDQYMGKGHEGYIGVMGTWATATESGYMPTDQEVFWCYEWLNGRALEVHEHGFTGPAGQHGLPSPPEGVAGQEGNGQ